MYNLTKFNAGCVEMCGYLWEESNRKVEHFGRVFSGIILGCIGSILLPALFAARTIGAGAWIVGSTGVFLIATIVLSYWRLPDLNATYCFSEAQIITHSRQKRYEKSASWDEIVDVVEIVCIMKDTRFYRHSSSYILLMRKSHIELNILIAADWEHNIENYSYLYRHPDIIAIPKTEETVRFIERFKTIKPLPEK